MKDNFMRAILIHLGTNLWFDFDNDPKLDDKIYQKPASKTMRFDLDLFREYTSKLGEYGINTIVLDLADGVIYDSHPEIAIEGSLKKEELKAELDRLSALGITVIPKLNFSTTHDVWLKDYARMVSTPTYYSVCRDLINEVCDIFKPKYFHIGMDEENYQLQEKYDYAVVRQNDLWWHDLNFYVDCIEENGARACMWSDYARHRPDEFVKKCRKSVVQCTWYYFDKFYGELEEMYEIRVRPFKILDEHGFDQFPGGSIEYFEDNIINLHDFAKETLSEDRYLGIMQTTWAEMTEPLRERHEKAAQMLSKIR